MKRKSPTWSEDQSSSTAIEDAHTVGHCCSDRPCRANIKLFFCVHIFLTASNSNPIFATHHTQSTFLCQPDIFPLTTLWGGGMVGDSSLNDDLWGSRVKWKDRRAFLVPTVGCSSQPCPTRFEPVHEIVPSAITRGLGVPAGSVPCLCAGRPDGLDGFVSWSERIARTCTLAP